MRAERFVHLICFTDALLCKAARSVVRFVMKCDDDMFLNVPNLLHVLLGGTVPAYAASKQYFDRQASQTLSEKNRLKQQERLLLGFAHCGGKIIRSIFNKWYMPSYMYDKYLYPNYLSGTGYVMSSDAAAILYREALKTPLLHLEDVFLTGANHLNIFPFINRGSK